MNRITLQPVSVLSDGGSHEGRLVFSGNDLVAVLTRVTPQETAGDGPHPGSWFLESGFGPCSHLMTAAQPLFATLDDALAWVDERLSAGLPGS